MPKQIKSIPKPPLSRMVKEGTIGTCPICKSTEVRSGWNVLGFLVGTKKNGCINPDCQNYYKNKQ